MNQFILMGRLTREPEVKYTAQQMAIAEFTLAVDRRGKDNGTDFIRITAFEKRAEFAERNLKKGMKVLVTGQIENNDYTNKDGKKVYGFRFLCSSVEFAEGRREEKPEESKEDFVPAPENNALPFI